MPRRPITRDGFRFAIICALPREYDAVYDSFDEDWSDRDYGKASGDLNRYATGCMGELPVVLLLLPGTGKADASSAAAGLRFSYKNVILTLLVGVCGAIPYLTDGTEVILGDVIISKYVVRYDFGRQYPNEFRQKQEIGDTLGRPDKETRTLTALLETSSKCNKLEDKAQILLRQLQGKMYNTKHRGIYDYVGVADDRLFRPAYRHQHYLARKCAICDACWSDEDPVCKRSLEATCAELGCSNSNLIERTRLQRQRYPVQMASYGPDLKIHVGGFGSADTVMKSGRIRDRLARSNRIIGFEMEGAGVWDELQSCLVIKGVCDYADSHKDKSWQVYAAATAASTAKALLQNFFASDRESAAGEKPDVESDDTESLCRQSKLGKTLFKQRKFSEAEVQFREAVEARKLQLGRDHKRTLNSLHWLGKALYKQAKYRDAEKQLNKAMSGRKDMFGREDEDTLASQFWLGKALFMQNKNTDAEVQLSKASTGQKHTHGREDEKTLCSLFWLGKSLFRQGKYRDAEVQLYKVSASQERILGKEDEDTLSSLHWLGLVLYERSKYRDAEETLRKAVAGRLRVFGRDDIYTCHSLHWLGITLLQQNKYSDAETHLRGAAAGRKRVLGGDDKETLETLAALGVTLYHQSKYGDAEGQLGEAVAGLLRVCGRDDKATFHSLYWLGMALFQQNMYGHAEVYFRDAVESGKHVHGRDNKNTLEALSLLGATLYQQNKYSDAEEQLREAVAGQRYVLGREHAATIWSVQLLQYALIQQNKYDDTAV